MNSRTWLGRLTECSRRLSDTRANCGQAKNVTAVSASPTPLTGLHNRTYFDRRCTVSRPRVVRRLA